ncbi:MULTISPECIES: MIP/aquaporin family protein [unclassified Granulicatella]|uniref:MIP/aquaporin family protein n=1 Tax=unclassified Granulicatella TaxID=2630493 RepID=UPI001073B8D1|nr:MIP/aquaporin family protein [Granulicatella sp. WM01]MBF0780283.1 aquaporin family protein [Granulicatella sp. 19428wC4_WM01]TFU95619.1 aquaporin family protein [Granulicatella sp. WM01]
MIEYIGEFLGTLVLIVFGLGFNASIHLKYAFAKEMSPNWLTSCVAWGVALMLGIFVASACGSSAHLNPAITLSYALNGMFNVDMVLGYIFMQMLGAFVGASIVVLHYYPHFKETSAQEGNTVNLFASSPALNDPLFNIISEFIATFFFIFVLLMINSYKQVAGLAPFYVPCLFIAMGLSFGSTTGYTMNPARDFAPRLAYAILPIPNKSGSNWSYAWIPIVAPILGASLAALFAKVLLSFV